MLFIQKIQGILGGKWENIRKLKLIIFKYYQSKKNCLVTKISKQLKPYRIWDCFTKYLVTISKQENYLIVLQIYILKIIKKNHMKSHTYIKPLHLYIEQKGNIMNVITSKVNIPSSNMNCLVTKILISIIFSKVSNILIKSNFLLPRIYLKIHPNYLIKIKSRFKLPSNLKHSPIPLIKLNIKIIKILINDLYY